MSRNYVVFRKFKSMSGHFLYEDLGIFRADSPDVAMKKARKLLHDSAKFSTLAMTATPLKYFSVKKFNVQ